MEADAAGADSAAAVQPPVHSTPARKEAQDPGKRREKQRAAAAAARKRREEKGPTPRELSRRREPPALPALPTLGAMPQAAVTAVDVAVVASRQTPAAPGDVADIDTHTAAATRGADGPPATKPITAPVISSPAELTTQCAVIQPLLQAAIREVARQRPADPLRVLADLLVSGADPLPPRDNPTTPEPISSAASPQSVAGYLSKEVLPGVHVALLELIRYQPPVTDDAALAAKIMARALQCSEGATGA